MSEKKTAKSLTFPLKQVTEIQIRAIDSRGAWLSLKKDEEEDATMSLTQFQKAIQDEHGYFYYPKGNSRLEQKIQQWLPEGFVCENGEIFEDVVLEEEKVRGNYWPLIVFLIIMLGGHFM